MGKNTKINTIAKYSNNMNKFALINLAILGASIVGFLVFTYKYFGWTIDDGFITLRYADNLANGYGFSWNYDETQEFGFSSYLHTILIALSITLGADALIFNKFLTISASIVTIIISGIMLRELTDNHFKFYYIPSLALGLMPFLAVHSVSGLETALFVALFSISVLSYVRYLQAKTLSSLMLTNILVSLSIFTRYEGILLAVGIFTHQLFILKICKMNIEFKHLLSFFIPVIFLLLLLSWNYLQFEQPLPNPFYVKKAIDFSDIVRNIYAISNMLVFVIPFLLLVFLNLKGNLKNTKTSYLIIQIVIALIPFILINQWINYFHRYYFHAVPILVTLGIFSFYSVKDRIAFGKYSKLVLVIIVLLLVLHNIPTNWKAREFVDSQKAYLEVNHIALGKILGKYEELNKNYIATIVDAGATPYYSKWKTYDYVLNDKYVVQHGFDADRFFDHDPKFIIISASFGGLANVATEVLEKEFVSNMQKGTSHGAEISLHPEFKNYKLLTFFSELTIFVEKEFAEDNPELMNEIIKASQRTKGI